MTIGTRMRAFRESLGMTRDEFEAEYGISASTLSGYERDQRSPHAEGLGVFAKAGANVNWLLTGEGEMQLKASELTESTAAPVLGVMEHRPSYGANAIDTLLLQRVIDLLYAWQHEHRARISQDKLGAVIAVLYRVAATSGRFNADELTQVILLAA